MLITETKKTSETLKNVVLLLLLLNFSTIFSQKKVIVIDPGHGGKDPGAIGINGIKEKDIALNIAKEVLHLNKTLFNNKYDIYLTRYTDSLISLKDRTIIPKALKADAFISIHCNAAKTNARGVEVYVNNLNSSILLGSSILEEATEKLGFKKREVKFANFQILKTVNIYPSLLIEIGFVTNEDEAHYFKKPKNLRAMALAIIMAITKT